MLLDTIVTFVAVVLKRVTSILYYMASTKVPKNRCQAAAGQQSIQKHIVKICARQFVDFLLNIRQIPDFLVDQNEKLPLRKKWA